MKNRIIRFVALNVFMIAIYVVLTSNWGLGFNIFNFGSTPLKYGLSWSVTTFVLGVFGYYNYWSVKSIRYELIHMQKLVVKDEVLTGLSDAFEKLSIAKRDNSKIENVIDRAYETLKRYESKLDIMNQLLANHGKKLQDMNFVEEFNEEATKEILDFVRQIIDTSIVFDDYYSNSDSEIQNAKRNIEEHITGIEEILGKYDEFLFVTKAILEEKLHRNGVIGTVQSLDITIDTLKQVYGLTESELDKLMKKYLQEDVQQTGGVS